MAQPIVKMSNIFTWFALIVYNLDSIGYYWAVQQDELSIYQRNETLAISITIICMIFAIVSMGAALAIWGSRTNLPSGRLNRFFGLGLMLPLFTLPFSLFGVVVLLLLPLLGIVLLVLIAIPIFYKADKEEEKQLRLWLRAFMGVIVVSIPVLRLTYQDPLVARGLWMIAVGILGYIILKVNHAVVIYHDNLIVGMKVAKDDPEGMLYRTTMN